MGRLDRKVRDELDAFRDALTLALSSPSARAETLFGSFAAIDLRPSISINPRDGTLVVVPGNRIPALTPSRRLLGEAMIDVAASEENWSKVPLLPPTTLGVVSLESPALYAHLVTSLLTKGYCKYDGFGGFVVEKTGRSSRLTFVASQVLKAAIRRPTAMDAPETAPVDERRATFASEALDHALPSSTTEPGLLPFVWYEAVAEPEPKLVRFLDLDGDPDARLGEARAFIEKLGEGAKRYALVYSADLRRNYGVTYDAVIAEVAGFGDEIALVYARCHPVTSRSEPPVDSVRADSTATPGSVSATSIGATWTAARCIGTTPNLLPSPPQEEQDNERDTDPDLVAPMLDEEG